MGFCDKIVSEAIGATNTFSPLTYTIFYKGENSVADKTISKICSVEGCGLKYSCRGLCSKHYDRLRKSGRLDTKRHDPSIEPFSAYFWRRVAVTADDTKCWIWQASKRGLGYGTIEFQGKQYTATHLAWLVTYGKLPTRILLHSCDNPPCVNPNHLKEGTHRDNTEDMCRKGRSFHKLTVENVLEIRERVANGEGIRAVARLFSVTHDSVRKIILRKSWKFV